ncbi:Glycine cleavage T-protein (aminomethyl transferase) [marine gamma proteobacterium HTCC2148]|jgi:dimethylglycine dehydrogenase|nr:Glycine cleavage T-protein (aminomethyl transferase) [marine gamma proteobacterium HTCC2148]MBT3409338.1 FAD-dependent oxidoreductase [Halieaceae bacterium]MBT6125789.1 FAD-dependent oxidoreductase [Halieaceae bacterium]
MKSHAQVVIVGGGSLGISLLYHLTKEGWTDILLVEKGELTSGSTWHAAGLCSNFIGNMTVAKIHDYSIRLYNEILPAETGDPSVFHQTGSLRIGYSKLEEEWFHNLASRAQNVPCEFNIISKQEAQELHPFINFDDARIIASTPNDGHVDPSSVAMPLAQLAKAAGAAISRFNRVLEINALPSDEWDVVTEQGTVRAQHVVNAGGCFAPEVGAMVGVKVPLVNLEHQYLVTDSHPALASLARELPVVRDSRCAAYLRQEGQGLLIGPYENWGSKPWALKGMDWGFDRELFQGDLERLMPFLDRCMERMPIFSEVGVKTVINGPITHTPDDNVLVGPQAGLRNFWNLCGSSIGIAQGGIGKYLAQWMVHGQTELNMASLDSRRFGAWADRNYCITKGIESYEVMYTAMGANENRAQGRVRRTSPLFGMLADKGAVHGVVAGYEKPLWFRTNEITSEASTWERSAAHPAVALECAAVQNAAGVIDISGSAKFEISGADAHTFLNRLSSNKLPGRDGRLGLTLFHGPNGGIMTEQSITRINEEQFYLIGPIASEYRDLHWMQQHADGYVVDIKNCTDDLAAVLLTGPKSRDILKQLTADDLSNSALPWLSCRTITLDSAPVRVMRVSYAGELGYELHMPVYQMPSIYESLFRVGATMGLIDFGGYAFNSMRMEKMYRAWGNEFTEEISGVEAGMERFIDTDRDFIGKENILHRCSQGVDIQLAYLAFDDDIACECFGNEAVYHSGELVGLTTGGAYGHRVGRSLAFAYLKPALVAQDVQLQVLTTSGMRNCHVEVDALYDPKNERLRG